MDEAAVFPNFHDGFVDGLLTSGRETSVFLRTVNGEKFTVVLHGVENLVLNDFRQGNIILSVDWLDPVEIHDSSIRDFSHLNDEAMTDAVRERWIEETKGKKLLAVEIMPSYGANLVAIFHGREIKRGHVAS